MKILSIHPEPPGSGNVVARVDIELNQDCRIFNLRLTKRGSGGYAIYSPNAMGARVATFSPALVEKISSAALAALPEPRPYDRFAN